MSKRVGVLGSGDVAQVLAKGFKRHGHEVAIGSRTPAKLSEFAANEGIAAMTFADAAAFGEILVLAVLGRAAEQALSLAGAGNLAGKTIVDTTNPISEEGPEQGMLRYFTGANESLMERLQAAHPKARFVKAFNSVGNAFMVDPRFPGGKPTMFICGDDAKAKADVARILEDFGWAPEDAGMVQSARAIEALCQLWCAPGFLRGQWNHAFHLLRA